MAVQASDLILQCAASRPDDDISAVGGARDAAARPLDSQLSANSVIAVVSDGADTRTITIEGRLAAGTVDTENLVLNGTTEVVGSTTFERILKITASGADGARTVTVRQGSAGPTRHTINPNETEAVLLFRKSIAGASAKDYYEKYFWLNNNGTDTLQAASVDETADASGLYTMALAGAKDDTESTTDRLTAPVGETFDNGPQNVPGTDLLAGEAIGVWFKMALGSSQGAAKDTFDSQISGQTA